MSVAVAFPQNPYYDRERDGLVWEEGQKFSERKTRWMRKVRNWETADDWGGDLDARDRERAEAISASQIATELRAHREGDGRGIDPESIGYYGLDPALLRRAFDPPGKKPPAVEDIELAFVRLVIFAQRNKGARALMDSWRNIAGALSEMLGRRVSRWMAGYHGRKAIARGAVSAKLHCDRCHSSNPYKAYSFTPSWALQCLLTATELRRQERRAQVRARCTKDRAQFVARAGVAADSNRQTTHGEGLKDPGHSCSADGPAGSVAAPPARPKSSRCWKPGCRRAPTGHPFLCPEHAPLMAATFGRRTKPPEGSRGRGRRTGSPTGIGAIANALPAAARSERPPATAAPSPASVPEAANAPRPESLLDHLRGLRRQFDRQTLAEALATFLATLQDKADRDQLDLFMHEPETMALNLPVLWSVR
ncbi:MAG TPA: hypothetical protein VFA70_05925 [Dehalococcoidia bacterium]|nr:hypothetical protein [Dehalococcoidia bacterium]